MKKRIRIAKMVWFLLFSGLFLSCSIRISAEESTNAFAETLPDEYIDFLEKLPDDLASILPDGLFSSNAEEVGEAVGELGDFSYLFETLLTLVGLRIGDCIRLFAILAGLLLLSAVSHALESNFSNKQIAQAFSFCSTLVLTVSLLMEGYRGLEGVSEYLSSLNRVTAASVPLMGSLYAMGGNISAAAASASGLTLFLSLLEGIVAKTVIPFCGICLAFTVINTCAPSLRLQTLSGTLKKNYTTVLTFLMMLLLAMLGAQTTLGAKSDTLAMKSVKFAAGNMIPVVGGSVSELLRTVSAGVGYLRGSVGICGVLLLLLLLLPTLVELLLLRLTWQLAASLADLLGCENEKRLLEEFASVSGYLIAAVSVTSSVPILAFSLLLHCASAIG